MKVTYSEKHSCLLQYNMNHGHEMFYQGPEQALKANK
jgi:hypothetical protein